MCCQDAAPVAPIAVRITEREWNWVTGGEEIGLSTGTFDKLSTRLGSREGTVAFEPTRDNLRAGVAEGRLSSGRVAESCVASHAAPG